MKTLTTTLGAVLIWLAASLGHAGELAIIVNDSNPASAMSAFEVKQHYLKDTARWDSGQKVRPADCKYDASVRNAFLSNVLGMTDIEIDRYWITQQYVNGEKPPATLDDDSSVMRFVAKFEGAIGCVDRGSLNGARGVKAVLTVAY